MVGGGQLGLGDLKRAGLIGMVAGWFSWSTLMVALVAGRWWGAWSASRSW